MKRNATVAKSLKSSLRERNIFQRMVLPLATGRRDEKDAPVAEALDPMWSRARRFATSLRIANKLTNDREREQNKL